MRVISLLPGATDAIVALGGADLLVGASHACDAPVGTPRVTRPAFPDSSDPARVDAEVRAAAAAGTALYALDADAIVALAPDLIVTQALCDVCAVREDDVRALARRIDPAPAVVTLSASTLDGVLEEIAVVGRAIGLADEADEVGYGLRHRLRRVHVTLKTARAPRPRVAVIEWTDPLYTAGHWVPDIVRRAGGVEVLGRAGARSAVATADEFREANPEIVVVAPCGYALADAVVAANYLLRAHPWLGDRAVWAIDANRLTSGPGPRLVDAVEAIAAATAPGLFRADPARQRRVT